MAKYLDYDGLEYYTQKVKGTYDPQIENLRNNGVKNLLNTYSVFQGNRYGVSYTTNADGSITNTAGTPTQNSNITVNLTLPAGTYYLCGCPDGGNSNEPYNYNAAVIGVGETPCKVTNSTMVNSFTLTETKTVTWRFRVYSGQSIAASTFYPMIYQYGDNSYQPYAMSNVELTHNVATNAEIDDIWDNT